MATVSGQSFITANDLYTSTATPGDGMELGQKFYGPAGKAFRYGLAGASNLVVGNVIQSSAIDTQFDDMAVPAAITAGTSADSGVVLTNGTTAVTAGQYNNGSLEISVTPGLGEEYTIIGHGTATNGSAWTLYLDRPLRTSWTTSTKATVKRSPWSGMIQAPATTLTGVISGIAIYPVTAAQYGFVQVEGIGAALSDASSITATNQAVCGGSGTAGCVTLQVAGLPLVGRSLRAAASGKTIPVMITLG